MRSTPMSWRSSRHIWPCAQPVAARLWSLVRPQPSCRCWRVPSAPCGAARIDPVRHLRGQATAAGVSSRDCTGGADRHRDSDSSDEIRQAVDELALRRQQRRTRVLTVLVAAVVAAAVALGGVVYTLVQARQAQVAQQAAETELLTAPDVQTYSATMKDGGQISFVVSRSLNRALFIGKDLPAVGSDRTYQLWTLEGERAIPDNLVAGGGDRKEFFRETLSGVTSLAVSIEAAGGAQQPTPSTIQTVTQLSS